ncbi:MAG TPA: LapA family protein [Sphingomonadaceae bacterium]
MSIIRTILWVLLVVALVIFSINNWTPVQVKIWEDLVLETKIPALVIVSFLLGLLPVWAVHTGTRWRLKRRINSLETAVRNAAAAAAPPNPDHPSMTAEPGD